jgi:glycosyltransferase involved in cell wall biosynthesis
LTFTSLFPNAQQPLHGLFVRERIRALARLCKVRVIAPVPWAPSWRWLGERYYRYAQVAQEEQQDGLTVGHPKFVVLPKIGKAIDGLQMAAWCLPALRALRQTFPFDLIDAHWASPDGVAAAILAHIFQVPLAITVRGDDINIFPREFWRRRFIQWALRRADLVIALSEELKHNVEALAVPPSKLVVIGNGVDPQRFHPVDRRVARRRLGMPQDGRILLAVGRLHLSKGYSILVEALALLQSTFPDLHVVIVGAPDHEADARPQVQAIVARHGMSDRVHLVGPQPQDVLVDWYGASDLFCLPTSREGSANVLLEALACGLPCITTPVGGNPEIIADPDVGVLVPAEAPALAKAIAASLCRAWDREHITAYACTRTWAVVAQECYLHLSRLVVPPQGRQA